MTINQLLNETPAQDRERTVYLSVRGSLIPLALTTIRTVYDAGVRSEPVLILRGEEA